MTHSRECDGPEEAPQALSPERLGAITRFASLEETAYAAVEAVVREAVGEGLRPEPAAANDPRTGMWISFSGARRRRPLSGGGNAAAGGGDGLGGGSSLHALAEGDNGRKGKDGLLPEAGRTARGEDGREAVPCIVCDCRLTPVVDRAGLCRGETFITPNLFPMVFPFPPAAGAGGRGMHFIQWCSTFHDADLHTQCTADVARVLERLAALERFLLHGGAPGFPRTAGGHAGWAAIMKNRGLEVGGSVEHGHQQIAHLSVEPRRIAEDRIFLEREGVPYALSLRRAAGQALTAGEFPDGVAAVVAPWMRRPLEAAIVPPEGAGAFLHDLDGPVLTGIAEALRIMTGALGLLMEQRSMTFAYNLAFHTGEVGLLYIEILPWTQPYGGFEHLGHYACQETPESAVRAYREVLGYR